MTYHVIRCSKYVSEHVTTMTETLSSCNLVEASQYGILQRCIELVEQENVSVVNGDEEGITVLHWAAINNRIPVARYVKTYHTHILLSKKATRKN